MWLQMNDQEWHWDGTDEEFIELLQWALIFRKLAKEQPQGWLKSAFDKARMMNACNESGITKAAVSLEMKKAASVIEKRESDRKLIEAIGYTIEEEINGLINKGKCF